MNMLIIDGYNVIHALARYRELNSADGKDAVDKLINDLVNLTGSSGIDITVVFDGRRDGSETKTGRLTVVYSSGKQSADSVIERLVFDAGDDRKIAVCTGDYAQQKVVGRRGVRRMAPRELEDMLTESPQDSREATKVKKRNRVEDRLPEDIKSKLEDLRRSPWGRS